MYPYARNWRAKGEQPVHEKCHVPVHTRPVLLRLDSTGEITSDNHFDNNNKKALKCDSKMGKFMDMFNFRKGPCLTKNCFVDPKVTLNDLDYSTQVMDGCSTSGNVDIPAPPKCSYWGCSGKNKTESKSLNFDYERCKQFHPAMTGSYYYSKHSTGTVRHQSEILKGLKICDKFPVRGMDTPRSQRKYRIRQRRDNNCNTTPSFERNQERAYINTNWRTRDTEPKASVESKTNSDNKTELECKIESVSAHCPIVGGDENLDIDFKEQSVPDKCTRDRNCDNSEHKHSINLNSEVQKSVLPNTKDTSCPKYIEKTAKLHKEDCKPQKESAEHFQKTRAADKTSPGDNQTTVQNESCFDWFECSGNITVDSNACTFTKLQLQPENDEEEKSAANNKRKILQREWSICSDIFQQEIKLTACFQDLSKEKSEVKVDSVEHGKDKCSQSNNEKEGPASDTSVESGDHHSKGEKAIEEKHDQKEYPFILFVRGGNKKCRPSAKKRQRSKLRKDLDETPSTVKQRNIDQHKSNSQSANKEKCNDSPTTNSVHFILNSMDVDGAPSSPSKAQSFMFTFNDSDIDLDVFSDSDESFDEDDSMYSAFSNPLDINVICSFGKKEDLDAQTDDKEPKSDIEAYNMAWRIIQVSTSPPVSDTCQPGNSKKVHFAEDDHLCSVHPMITWRYAYAAARKGPWEAYARDRSRFQRRIKDNEAIIGPVFSKQRRDKVLAEQQK